MSRLHFHRLILAVFFFLGSMTIIGLTLYALKNNVNLFYTPTEVQTGLAPLNQNIRVGGMVVKNSIERGSGVYVEFKITDYAHTIKVKYEGILPDLFREEQGIVAEGLLNNKLQFIASQVLAKHDENYMPPEVKASLKETKQ